jgi:predicted HNH restriction endonuclease
MAPIRRQGYVSMNILHSFGLVEDHKGFFYNNDILYAIELLDGLDDMKAKIIARSLERYNQSEIVELTIENDEIEYPEGRIAYRQHKIRERDPRVAKEAKKRFKEKNNGNIFCEACGFNFKLIYGQRGSDFIESHHKRPISSMNMNEATKVKDIALLCSNCHKMIHKSPMITVEALAKAIIENKPC